MKENVKVLFLGAAKKVSLVESFHRAAKQLELTLDVFSFESSKSVPIAQKATIIECGSFSEEDTFLIVKSFLEETKIDMVVACVDSATLLLSRLSDDFDCAKFSSPVSVNNLCQSKLKFQDFCEAAHISIIPSVKTSDINLPIFVKPDRGSASIGAEKVNEISRLMELKKRNDLVFQRYISGKEYSVDSYVSLNGEICGISIRERIKVLGGESVETQTLRDNEIFQMSSDIIKLLNLKGPICLQFMRESKTGALYLIEINPRFGGGVIASIEAGFNFPRMMLQDLMGGLPEKIFQGKEIIMKRYFCEVFFEINH